MEFVWPPNCLSELIQRCLFCFDYFRCWCWSAGGRHSDRRTHTRALSIRRYAIAVLVCSMCIAHNVARPEICSHQIIRNKHSTNTFNAFHNYSSASYNVPNTGVVSAFCLPKQNAQFPYSKLCSSTESTFCMEQMPGLLLHQRSHHPMRRTHIVSFCKKNPFRFFSTNSKLHAWNRVRYCMVFAWQTA